MTENIFLVRGGKSMVYLCKAYEQQYQRLHDIYAIDLFCENDERRAVMNAINLSYDVMNSYSCIADAIEEDYQYSLNVDKPLDIQKLYDDNIAFELYEVHTDKDFEDLMEQFCDNFREIVLASIEIDESQYSKVIRQFYIIIGLSDDGNDEFVYDSAFWNFLTKFDDSPKYEYLK